MPRSEEADAQWEIYKDELESLWLDKRWNAMQIQEYMSQQYDFHKDQSQYNRRFHKWGFEKNLRKDEWEFIAHRQAKRKREGKPPGQVKKHNRTIPDEKVRKETSRYVNLSSQYLNTDDPGPPTPNGIAVDTPQPEVESSVSNSAANSLGMTRSLGVGSDLGNQITPVPFLLGDMASPSLMIDLPELESLNHYFSQAHEFLLDSCGSEENLKDNLPPMSTPWTSPSTVGRGFLDANRDFMFKDLPTVTEQCELDEVQAYALQNSDEGGVEPGSFRDIKAFLAKETDWSSAQPSMSTLKRCLRNFIYLSSNDMLSDHSTRDLVLLIAKSNAYSVLTAVLKSRSTTIEIFMSNLLSAAVGLGETQICRILIQHGADLDARSGMGMLTAPLLQAVQHNHLDCARMLLDGGANPNLRVGARSPLHVACLSGCPLEAVELLLHFQASVNPPQDSAKLTPLQMAVDADRADLTELLLRRKADPNLPTTSRLGTALQIACQSSSNADIVELLVSAGADINMRVGSQGVQIKTTFSEGCLFDFLDSDSDDSNSDIETSNYFSNCIWMPNSCKPAVLIAAIRENWEAVQLLLEEGANINATLSKYPTEILHNEISCSIESRPAAFTPLQAAARAGNITMTRQLLQLGAHIDARPNGSEGHTALQICASTGNLRLAKILLQKGADINAPAGVYHGRTALQAAAMHADVSLLIFLLEKGADVNAAPSKKGGRTALQVAAANENIEGVRILLEAGAIVNTDPNRTDGKTALQEAILIKGDEVVKSEIIHLLLRAGAHTKAPKDGDYPHHQLVWSPLHAAVQSRNSRVTRELLEKGVNSNPSYCATTRLTPLQRAASLGDSDIVQLLISHGAKVNFPPHPDGGRTALQAAVEGNHMSVSNTLLKFGASIRSKIAAKKGISAIQAAAANCNLELIQMLLDQDPEAISSDHTTKINILRRALSTWRCEVDLLKLLIKHGAEINTVPASSEVSILQAAAMKSNFGFVQYLISAGADLNYRCHPNYAGPTTALQAAADLRHIDNVALLLKSGAEVNAPANEKGGMTALQFAVKRKHRVMVKLLIEHGADVNALPSPMRGRTALQQAVSEGSLDLIRYLIARGADINAPAARFAGVTALQAASIHGDPSIVILLLKAGAHINGAPAIESGRNAIEAAAENGRIDALHALLNYHPDTKEFDIWRRRAARLAMLHGRVAIERFLRAYRKHSNQRG
ncbi:ankyrin repeat-containing domain protein [Penicillium macrosclerotiorum]|uniref:ankyrin repeat-containing domain protein n=1 Tax=Penicillium macrosclerotiorum TaxID=303699 RepID=UPI0025470A85|nr:ankyrin repeat-containing domain protein [Penicillium macrosclerotiorum]KAJ5692526.1 ankyrin repeat-containing domain protein [Penicillium macrosclerotiorum]